MRLTRRFADVHKIDSSRQRCSPRVVRKEVVDFFPIPLHLCEVFLVPNRTKTTLRAEDLKGEVVGAPGRHVLWSIASEKTGFQRGPRPTTTIPTFGAT